MTGIHQLGAADRALLRAYAAIDKGGEAFADENCTVLVSDWREVAETWIAPVAQRLLVLCTSPDGWSLHAPGSSDEDITDGSAPYLACGAGEPTDADYVFAWLRHFGVG